MKEILLVLILMPVSILGTTAARMVTAECLLFSEWVQFNARIEEASQRFSYTDFKQLKTCSPKAE
jgi:hypothetical protein